MRKDAGKHSPYFNCSAAPASGILVWVIALGGMGASTYNCTQENPYSTCAKEFQWEW